METQVTIQELLHAAYGKPSNTCVRTKRFQWDVTSYLATIAL